MSDELKRIEIFVEGRVQGVWFRAETQKEAERLGLDGYVENMPDGSVHVVAEGEEEKLQRLIEYCKHGPPLARVEKIKTSWSDFQGEFKGFRVKYRY